MIFTAPRFVVVDDKEHHLRAISDTLQSLGAPCMGIHFDPESGELNQDHFRGVRCLFMDLHLIDDQASSDQRRHYGLIASILEDNISKRGGPFILVVWTEHPHLSDELRQYLDEKIDVAKPHARPLAVIPLEKGKFIDVGDGAVCDAVGLRAEVDRVIKANPQLAALLAWESDVLTAAGDTLAALLDLVPSDQRKSTTFSGTLDVVLSRLAREAVGRPHVEFNKRAAITSALAPILADRVVNQVQSADMRALWDGAITRHDDDGLPPPTAADAGVINRMLHISLKDQEPARSSDWGSVVDMPSDLWGTDQRLKEIFDLSRADILKEEFKVKPEDHGKCKPRLVRIGAACDHAQKRRGPLPYLLAIEVPHDLKQFATVGASVWKSPIIQIDQDSAPSYLLVNARFMWSITSATCETWDVPYRLRQQLLMELSAHVNNYSSRPGIVRLALK